MTRNQSQNCCVLYLTVYCTPYIYVLAGVISYVLHLYGWHYVCTSLFSVIVSKHYVYFVSIFCITIVCSCVLAICTA